MRCRTLRQLRCRRFDGCGCLRWSMSLSWLLVDRSCACLPWRPATRDDLSVEKRSSSECLVVLARQVLRLDHTVVLLGPSDWPVPGVRAVVPDHAKAYWRLADRCGCADAVHLCWLLCLKGIVVAPLCWTALSCVGESAYRSSDQGLFLCCIQLTMGGHFGLYRAIETTNQQEPPSDPPRRRHPPGH